MSQKSNDLIAKYESLWDDFVSANLEFEKILAEHILQGESFHAICARLYGIPYYKAKGLFEDSPSDSKRNIGSVTGLFFEHFISFVIASIAKKKFPDIQPESNKCTDAITREISRDPDLFLKRGENRVVVEFKVSPKKPDIDYVVQLKSRYEERNIYYCVVGGHISLDKTELDVLTRNDWMTFFDSSKRNNDVLRKFKTIDQIMDSIWKKLGGN